MSRLADQNATKRLPDGSGLFNSRAARRWRQSFREERLGRRVEPELQEVALAWQRLDPVALPRRSSFGTEREALDSVRAGLRDGGVGIVSLGSIDR